MAREREVVMNRIQRTNSYSGTQLQHYLSLAGLLIFLTVFAFLSLQNPIFTWDLVAYTGSAFSWRLDDPVAIHTATYALLEAELPAPAWQSLISGEYPAAMASSASEFHSQLQLYLIRPLYVGLIVLLGLFGLSYVQAGLLLSVVPALALCVLAFQWFRHHVPPHYALACVILLAFSSRLFDISRLVLPDALSAFVLVLGLYLLIEKVHLAKWGAAILVLSVLVRTDNILLVGPVLVYLSIINYQRNTAVMDFRVPAAALALAVLAYLTSSLMNDHGWWRLFHHTFIESIVDLEGFDAPFSLSAYLSVLAARLQPLFMAGFVVYTMMMPFMLLAIFGLLRTAGIWQGQRGTMKVIVLVCLLNMLVYFFLFPLVETWDRFFIPYYFLISIFAVQSIQRPDSL